MIAQANGDNVHLREAPSATAKVVGSFPEGSAVLISGALVAGDASTSWYPATIGGKNGFIASEFVWLASSGSTPTPPPAPPIPTNAKGWIFNTNGDGIRCRDSASLNGVVLFRFIAGDVVTLTGDASAGWQPVVCPDKAGFVASEFITLTAPSVTPAPVTQNGAPTVTPQTTTAPSSGPDVVTANAETGSTAVVAGTNGDGVRCRTSRSLSASIITVLPEGTGVPLRSDIAGNWTEVTCAGQDGWVVSKYLSANPGPGNGNGGDGGTPTSTATPPSGAAAGFNPGDAVVVANTNGDGVRLRSQASTSASVIVVLPEGTAATVRSGSSGDWVAVTYKTSNGFIFGDYLAIAATGGGNPTPTPAPSGGLGNGDHAMVTANLNFRTGPSLTSTIIGVASQGDVVLITGTSTSGFYPVQYLQQDGWMGGDYLTWTDAALTVPPLVSGNAGSGGATKEGQAMVDYAMKYLGYPYVWATHGPSTFDCSGFTYWVVMNTLKQNIGTGTWTQFDGAGNPVQYGDLRPGDLVFFQNTYT